MYGQLRSELMFRIIVQTKCDLLAHKDHVSEKLRLKSIQAML